MLLPGEVHGPRPTPPPYVVAKTLTQYLFGETALPSFLQQYGDILLAITGGAAAATGLCWFFQPNKCNRKRIRLAVYHVVRTLQIMPDLEERMEEMPEDLYKEIAREVDRMIGTYLTLSESETTFRMAKRKLLDDYEAFEREREAERRVRRRVDDAAAGDVPEITVQSPSSTGQPEGSLIHQEETQQDDELEMYMLGYNPTASHSSPVRERPSPTAPDIDLNFSDFRIPSSEQSRGSRGSPSSLGFLNNYSSSPPARPSNPTPRRGRGGPYSSDDTPSPQRLGPIDLSSEDVPSGEDERPILRPSNPTPRRAQGSIDVQVDTPRPKTARENRPDLDQESHDLYTSPASRDDTPPEQESPRPRITSNDIRERRERARASDVQKTAVQPRSTVALRQPPSALAAKTQGEVPGRYLSPIREGISPHVSPAEGTKQYRVAETRKLNKQLEGERLERRLFKKRTPSMGEQAREIEAKELAEGVEAGGQEALPESSQRKEPSEPISTGPEDEDDDDLVHFEDSAKHSTSTGAIVTVSPAVRHDNPLPAAATQSSSPRSMPSSQATIKGQSRRSAAPSPPESTEKTPAKTAAAKAPAKTPAKTPAKQKALPTIGTRKSGRIAKLKGEKK
ncbi:uncharacterized protein J4E87_000662 [Alternaria ethzedia]|uniref:uncharacterized protein n=1 Tax=Alternaria ethzedia TaxID=181014 RepID=UPI0020C4411D|nr:uncharacterized protein J4E87_000662 [Alternaria ethzedia]KAI4635707.1 hypothetical protein J4E87_000662 [Alternaria ethzedia]